MAGMHEFLTQIGAASLSPVIELPVAGSKPRLAALHDRLQAEIDSVNDQTRNLLQNSWPEFQAQFIGGQDLLERIRREEEELVLLEGHLSGKDAILPPLLLQLTSHSALAISHAESQHSVSALTAVLALHSLITSISDCTTSGALPTAVSQLETLHSFLSEGADDWIEQLDSWRSLVKWASEEEVRLEGSLVGAMEACFEFQGTAEGAQLVLKSRLAAAPQGQELDLLEVMSSLEEMLVRSGKSINSHLARIAKHMMKYFLGPLFEADGKVTTAEGRLGMTYNSNEEGIQLATRGSSKQSGSLLDEVKTFLTWFGAHSSLLPPSRYAAIFTAQLTPSIQSLVVSLHLIPSLPASISLLPEYFVTLSSASTFESEFLVFSGYLSFLPAGEETLREEGRVIGEWMERVDQHWARKVGDAALEEVRELILTNDWKAEIVEVEIPVEVEEEVVKPIVEEKRRQASAPPTPVRRTPTPPPNIPILAQPIVAPLPPIKVGRKLLGTKIAKVTPIPPSPPLLPRPEPDSSEATSPEGLLTTSRVTPIDAKAHEDQGEGEDAWGFTGDGEPAASAASKPLLDAGESKVVKRKPSVANSEGGDDAWGFGEEEENVDQHEGEGGADGWGFTGEASPSAKPLPPTLIPSAPIPSPEIPIRVPTSPATSEVATSLPISPPSPAAVEEDSWGWEPEEDTEETSHFKDKQAASKGLSGGSQIRKEMRMISMRSRAIVQTAERILSEAIVVGSPGFAHPSFASASVPLFRSFSTLLSLYRAIAPVYHDSLLLSVPAIGMQFANDAEWIGEEVSLAWRRLEKGKGREMVDQDEKVEECAGLMKRLGSDWREKQVSAQRTALMEILDGAGRFLYTSDDPRYRACENALAQVSYLLEKLAQVWKPVLNPTLLYSTLGYLVNEVLSRVLLEIEDQADISEEESIRLNKLCKILHGLEDLFVTGGNSSVGREVNVWFKFVFLSELLEASMADILFLFDNGHLVDFSTGEIAKLVRALFSDSPLRLKNLVHIMKGHPEVVERGDGEEDEW